MSKTYQSNELTDEALMRAAGAAVGFTFSSGLARNQCSYLCECDESLLLINAQNGHTVWNPLKNSGQALELAVLGQVRANFPEPSGKWFHSTTVDKDGGLHTFQAMGEDAFCALRKSIVLAVAGSA